MNRKFLLIAAITILICSGTLMAATPSVFEVGLLNYFTVQDITDSAFAKYTPGVRMAFYLSPWFGLSGDMILQEPFSGELSGYHAILSTDVVVRWPLGFFEPYLALGPAYEMVLNGSDFTVGPKVMYNGRIGFDFNITPLLCLGIEAKHFITDIPSLVDGSGTFDLLKNTYAGLAIKIKL